MRKPRGILVKFVDKSQRRDILRGSKNLQSCLGKKIAKTIITKDLTLTQRLEIKTAREKVRNEF